MPKCKQCGSSPVSKYGYCEDCIQIIKKDIVLNKDTLESLANLASPFLNAQEKDQIYKEATTAYNALQDQKQKRLPFFKSDPLQLKNNVLERLGLPAEVATVDPVVKSRSVKNTLLFSLIITFIVIVFGIFLSQKAMQLAKQTPEEMLIYAARQEVTNLLVSPSSAKFPPISGNNYTIRQDYSKENVYLVSSYVDSQNSFGAVLRSNFFATIQFDFATETYRVLNIEIT